MRFKLTKSDCFGLVRPALDAHTLGISSLAQLLDDCGYKAVVADADACKAFDDPQDHRNIQAIAKWVRKWRVTVLGLSYRLDPSRGAELFCRLCHHLKMAGLFRPRGTIRGLFFAGLPRACAMVKERMPEADGVFCGDETPLETLKILGIDPSELPGHVARGVGYDDDRLSFGKDLIAGGRHLRVEPVDRNGYSQLGTRRDTLLARLEHHQRNNLGPLMRAHVGPYLQDRQEAVNLFLQWCRELASAGFLDVLSIGTSQLTQEHFGQDWAARPNGGGVPLNSAEEFVAAWQAARPMLVRTYAGTRNIPALARMYEDTINIAWHALSLWWFCRIDGRGPYTVRENLRQHVEALRYIASTGKPFEPNVPHHFAFRGADDVTCIVSAVLAARLAKRIGIRCLVLQNMLNTPKYIWGIADLAKARAMLSLVRQLEDNHFRVILQPRGGLDHFSPDLDKAKAQLAAVTALMDDIEPHDSNSPQVIHVVSYCEASHLADPIAINESIQITRCALEQYRLLRRKGQIDDMAAQVEVAARTEALVSQAAEVLDGIEKAVPQPYTAEGLYRVLEAGFLPAPYLWECRDEFHNATRWRTKLLRGGVEVVDNQGCPIRAGERMRQVMSMTDLVW